MPDTADRLAADAVAEAARRRPAPAGTYRFQMHKGFPFRAAERAVPYLRALGVTHLYLSPILAARPGSTHGYDVIDPTILNPELGTDDDYRALVAAARANGMGLVLDTVPNHMAVGPANRWWRDVLEHGPSSQYAGYFDIAWDDPPRADLRGRLALPVLGAPYYQVLEAGELRLGFADGAFCLHYWETALPVDPRTYDRVLRPALDRLAADAGPDAPATTELRSILTSVKNLPARTEADPDRVAEGRAEAAVVKRRLAALAADPAVAAAVAAAVAGFAAKPGDPASVGPLDALLDAQPYRVCYWRVASDEINYRRFFDVNELAAVSAERDDVFRDTHGLLLKLLAGGLADGVRIDHIDGLFEPGAYLARLQREYVVALAKAAANPDEWPALEAAVRERVGAVAGVGSHPPLYVVVEKILARAERMPADWPADGTTGYEFVNAVNGLFVDPAGEKPLGDAYEAFTGRDDPFPEVVFRRKGLVLTTAFSSELDMLARQLDRLARTNRRARDFTLNGLRRALWAAIASFPVYRAYAEDGINPSEEAVIRLAVRRARRRSPTLSPDLFDYIRDTLLLKPPPAGAAGDDYAAGQLRFAGKFMQVTSPVTAKGIEDTAFYQYFRLASLNEVGGEPGRFGWDPKSVHEFFADRQARNPLGLSAGATHDTKRGEDVRTRIDVLSEVPAEWAARAGRWAAANRRHKTELDDGQVIPDPNDEYLVYQTLVGAWPADADTAEGLARFRERMKEYMSKATHEAKEHTSWINPNPEYDAGVAAFLDRVLDGEQSAEFLADLRAFRATILRPGVVNSLAQSLLRCTAPGVPDTYQGTEFWDLSLVDPDNRRPVDYEARERCLAELDGRPKDGGFFRDLLARAEDGAAKLYLTATVLRFRRDHAGLFRTGEYVPLEVAGANADRVFAFLRRTATEAAVVVVPRLVAGLSGEGWPLGPGVWGDTAVRLPEGAGGTWRDVLTGAEVAAAGGGLRVGEVFARFPVGLLVS